MRRITTIRDAEQLVADWTERHSEQPTPAQIHRAARALVAFLGGYGADADAENDATGERVTAAFDLDAALQSTPAEQVRGREHQTLSTTDHNTLVAAAENVSQGNLETALAATATEIAALEQADAALPRYPPGPLVKLTPSPSSVARFPTPPSGRT